MPHDNTHHTLIAAVIQEILAKAGFAVIATWSDERLPRARIHSNENLSLLIGTDGNVLASLEHLVRLVALRRLVSSAQIADFMLDINDYRKKQIDRLAALAQGSAERVIATGRAESLAPMNAFERKIVHTELTSYSDLETQSIGAEPNRRVVIKRISL